MVKKWTDEKRAILYRMIQGLGDHFMATETAEFKRRLLEIIEPKTD